MRGARVDLLERVPAERATVGFVLRDPHTLPLVAGLAPKHFADPVLAIIWATVLACQNENPGAWDSLTVYGRLERTQQLERIGGETFLWSLTDNPDTIREALPGHARVIIDRHLRRELHDAAAQALDRAKSPEYESGTDILQAALTDLQTVGDRCGAEVATGQRLPDESPATKLVDWRSSRFAGPAPARRYLVNRCFPMAAVSLLAAAGDTGKGMLTMDLALKVANLDYPIPQEAFGSTIATHGTAVIFTAEDDADEVHRRMAALDQDGIRDQLGNRLCVVPMPDDSGPIHLIVRDRHGPRKSPAFEWMREQLLAVEDLALVVLDPLASFVSIDINADPAIGAFVMGSFAELAKETGAALLVCHHMRKPSSSMDAIKSAADARHAIRGSTAIVDGARCAYALWTPDEKDAAETCKLLGYQHEPNSVVHGAVVKSNGPADLTERTYLRDAETGLLRDVTEQHDKAKPDLDILILRAICDARPAFDLSQRGANSIWANRRRLPEALARLTRNQLEGRIAKLLRQKKLVEKPGPTSKNSNVLALPPAHTTYSTDPYA
jgi:hypothetical protein